MKFYTLVLTLVALATLGISGRAVAAEQESNKSGFYIEGGGVFMAPIAGREVSIAFADDPSDEVRLGPGGGAQASFGYDWRYVGVGTRLTAALLSAQLLSATAPPSNSGDMFIGWDVESKLYVLDWFDISTDRFRPYGLVGVGLGVMGPGFPSQGGLTGNFGAGVQWNITRRLYVALEASYRPMLFGETEHSGHQWFSTQPYYYKSDDSVHAIDSAITVGFRF